MPLGTRSAAARAGVTGPAVTSSPAPAPAAGPARPAREPLVIQAMGPQGPVKLLSTSVHHEIVEAILDSALSFLETTDVTKSLVEVAMAVIKTRNTSTGSIKRVKHHIYKDKPDRMPFWVGQFLAALRKDFPPIFIDDSVKGEAEVERAEWGSKMEQYDASKAGDFFLSEPIINNMAWVRTQPPADAGDAYNIFKFQMAISVAHEIVHLLVGFLTGKATPDTPTVVTGPGYGEPRRGESGRYWEHKFLGGYLECWSVDSHALDRRQPGLPYLFKAGPRATSKGQRVSATYIAEFLEGTFKIPIAVSSTHPEIVTRGQLGKRKSVETTDLRNSPKHKLAVREKPPPPPETEAEATARYRSTNPGPVYGPPQGNRGPPPLVVNSGRPAYGYPQGKGGAVVGPGPVYGYPQGAGGPPTMASGPVYGYPQGGMGPPIDIGGPGYGLPQGRRPEWGYSR